MTSAIATAANRQRRTLGETRPNPRRRVTGRDLINDPAIRGLESNTVLIAVHFSLFGQRRALDDGEYSEGTEKRETSAQKRRLDSPALTRLATFAWSTREWVRGLGAPSGLQPGVQRIPLAMLAYAIENLEGRKAEFDRRVTEFVADYPAALQRTAVKLGTLFHADEYPDVSEVAEEFDMGWRILASGPPTALSALNASVFQREREKFAANLAEYEDRYRVMLRASVLDLTEKIADMLRPDPDGKPKQIRSKAFAALTELLSTMPQRNVIQDAELATACRRVDRLLRGVDADVLRDDASARAEMGAKFTEAAEALSGLVEKAKLGQRRIVID